MKNIAFAFAATLALAFAARAEQQSFLYWMVEEPAYYFNGKAVEDFDYARVSADGGTSYLNIYSASGDTGTSILGAGSGAAYAGVFDADVSGLSFLVELYNSADEVVAWRSYTALEAAGSIASAADGRGAASPLSVRGVVPEPSSALLALLGLSGLALRRRRAVASFALAALLAAPSFAAQDDILVTFSTPGPDVYADGTVVMDGECYALAWTPAGSPGLAIAADGSATGGEVVLVAPVAKGGRCPAVVFEVAASRGFVGGEWSVWLMDTRRFAPDGTARLAGISGGRARLVNAASAVGGASVAASVGSLATLSSSMAAAATAPSALPEGVTAPSVTGIRVADGLVYVTVKGTSPYLAYGLESGNAPDSLSAADASRQTGAASPEDEVTFVAPAREGAGFFRVGRSR